MSSGKKGSSSLNPLAAAFHGRLPGRPIVLSPVTSTSEASLSPLSKDLQKSSHDSGCENSQNENIVPSQSSTKNSQSPAEVCSRADQGQDVSPPVLKNSKEFQRSVYSAIKDIVEKEDSKDILSGDEPMAKSIFERYAGQLHHLIDTYPMEELVDAVTTMDSLGMFTAEHGTVREKWPWLLKTCPSDNIHLTVPNNPVANATTSKIRLSPSTTSPPRKDIRTQVINIITGAYSSPSKEDRKKKDSSDFKLLHPTKQAAGSIDSKDPQLPPETQRAIVQEAQSLLKQAFCEFARVYLRRKGSHDVIEPSESSALGNWIILFQDALDEPDQFQNNQKLLQIAKNKDTLLDPAITIYDKLLNQRPIVVNELQILLSELGMLHKALDVASCISKHEALKNYVSGLISSLEMKLGEIQQRIVPELRRIAEERQKLNLEENSLKVEYHESKKVLMKELTIDVVTIKNHIANHLKGSEGEFNLEGEEISPTPTEMEILAHPKTPVPEICVWSPEESLIEYQSGVLKSYSDPGEHTDVDMPWGSAAIDDAISSVIEGVGEIMINEPYCHAARCLQPIIRTPDSESSKQQSVDPTRPDSGISSAPRREMEPTKSSLPEKDPDSLLLDL